MAGKTGTGAATAASAACPVGRGKEARSTPASMTTYQINQSINQAVNKRIQQSVDSDGQRSSVACPWDSAGKPSDKERKSMFASGYMVEHSCGVQKYSMQICHIHVSSMISHDSSSRTFGWREVKAPRPHLGAAIIASALLLCNIMRASLPASGALASTQTT